MGEYRSPVNTPCPSPWSLALTFFSFLILRILRKEPPNKTRTEWELLGKGWMQIPVLLVGGSPLPGLSWSRGRAGFPREERATYPLASLLATEKDASAPPPEVPCQCWGFLRGVGTTSRSLPPQPSHALDHHHSCGEGVAGAYGTLRNVSLSDSKVRITPKLHRVDTRGSPASRGSRTTKPLPSTRRMGGSWRSSLESPLFFLGPFCSWGERLGDRTQQGCV